MESENEARLARPVERVVGQVVNPHVLPYAKEPRPDFEAMQKAINEPICQHCGKPAPGWTDRDIRRGRRDVIGAIQYHCYEAKVDD